MRRLLAACALAASATAMPAWAQQSTDQDPGIVVEGELEQERKIKAFIGAFTKAPPRGQIGQFHSQVCPIVLGVGDEQGMLVNQRIRKIARAAEVPVAGERCRPNVLVLIVSDKRGLVAELDRKQPWLFGERSNREIRALIEAPGDAVAWHVATMINRDGRPMYSDRDGMQIARTMGSTSRIFSQAKPTFKGAILVIDRDAIAGLSTTQLADYAAMRLFADTDPADAPAGAATILTLLEDWEANRPTPLTMTPWDLSFLKSLYGTSNDLYATAQRGQMESQFKRELGKVETRPAEAEVQN